MSPRRRQSMVGSLLAAGFAIGCVRAAPLPAKAVELNRMGAEALAAGDLDVAEARVALALEYNQRFTEGWVNMGLVEMSRGRLGDARSDFVKARALNPDLPVPHHALGLISEREGHPEEAERRYRAALKVDPGFSPARLNLGRLLFERGAFEESREQFLRLTQVAPDVLEGWTSLCEALFKLGRTGEVDEVVARAKLRFGYVGDLEILQARSALQRGAVDDAERSLERIAAGADARLASRAEAWLAVARLAAGDVVGAREAASAALSLDPEQAVAAFAMRQAGAGGFQPTH